MRAISLVRFLSGFVVLTIYRVCIRGAVLLADELGSIVGKEEAAPYLVPLCAFGAVIVFGYAVRQFYRVIE